MATSTFDSTKGSLTDLLTEATEGSLQLPDFQRGWVWDDDHIRDLLASISMAFPIGTVMLLQTGGDSVRFKTRPVEGADPVEEDAERLILDGQQRITSLFQSLSSGKPVQTRDDRGKPLVRWYYMDIERALDPDVDRVDAILSVPEDRVIKTNFGRDVVADYSNPEGEYESRVFPLIDSLDPQGWRRGFFKHWNNADHIIDLWDRFEAEILDQFKAYQLPVITLKKETPKEAVCLVFEKVNTGGVALTVFELLTATFAADNFDLRVDWDARRRHMLRQTMVQHADRSVLADVANTDFLQSLTLLTTYETREGRRTSGESSDKLPAVSCKRRDVLKLTAAEYQRWADDLEQAMIDAARFLHREHVFEAKFLPYRTQLVPLAAILAKLGARAQEETVRSKLVRWYWCGVFGELYGSATETRFARDLPQVLAWIDGGPEPDTVSEANLAPERLERLRTRNSAAYRGIYVLLLREGAHDFRTGEPSNLQSYFDEAVDIHHVFPRKWCKDQGVDAARYDSVINKTPLTARTNRIIGGRAPSDYLRILEENHGATNVDEHVETHLADSSTLRSDDFEEFFASRRSTLLGRIGAVMGKDLQSDESEAVDVPVEYDDTELDADAAELVTADAAGYR